MNRGSVHALVLIGAMVFALFVFDRPDFMRLIQAVRGFVSEHAYAVIVTLLALLGARIALHSPHQINRL